MDEHRSRRVSEAVKTELTELIGFELDDPRLTDVSVTNAEVSADMRHAHVKVSITGEKVKVAMAGLEHAKHFLRNELASRLNLRRVPELHFSADNYPEAESRIDFLLRRASKNRAKE